MNQAHIPGLVRRISYSSNESSAIWAVDPETAVRHRTRAPLPELGSLSLGIHLGSTTDGIAVRS
jgi:hypothetical protein